MTSDDDYYGDSYYDDTDPITSSSTLGAVATTTSTTTLENTPQDSISAFASTTKNVVDSETVHPFGESLPLPEGESGSPEISAAEHPFGEGAAPEHPYGESSPFPEGEGPAPERPYGESSPFPEGESAPQGIAYWPYYNTRCTSYADPFVQGEPEPEVEPNSIISGGAYAEPPAPLLQSVNFRDRGVYSTLAGAVAALIIFLNIVVLVAIAKKPKQRKSLTFLIALVAGFDLLGGLQFLWFSSFDLHLMYTHADMWILVMCGIWMLSMAPQITAMMHFGLHLMNELDLGVGHASFSTGRIVFIIVTVFHLPLALFIPPLAGWNCIGCVNPPGEKYCQNKCSIPIFPFTKNYVLLMTLLLLFAVIIVIAIYCVLHVKASKKASLVSKSGNCDAIKLSRCLLITYIVCIFPVAVVMIVDFATVDCNPELINAFHATLFVTFLSNLVNPMVVFAKMPSMRSVFIRSQKNLPEAEGNGVNGAFAMENSSSIDDKKIADEEAASKI